MRHLAKGRVVIDAGAVKALRGKGSLLPVGVVEVEGAPRLLTSCTLEATEGMAVRTHTPRVLKARRAIMELLIARHPQDCLSCVRGGDCELATLAGDLGVRRRRYVGAVKQHPMDISSPALWRDPNKCVLCGRCVTTCHEVQGVGAIDFTGRGFRTRVAPGFSVGLNLSDCVYCGQCARVCPTEVLCEQACVRNSSEDKPVEIGLLQRHATDHLMAHPGAPLFTRAAATGKRVAVVGAGPAGLACAHRLALLGHSVVVLDAREKPGGLNE